MRTLGNIIWNIPFLGFVTAALVFLIGLLFVVTIIGSADRSRSHPVFEIFAPAVFL